MAEFQYVMKQAQRMCNSFPLHKCGDCKAFSGGVCLFKRYPVNMDEKAAAKVEDIALHWAAEHPEPRYPTWNEWYKATFPDSNYHTIPCPSMFYKICETSNYHGEVECYECKNSPIPADIADKLGIKAIGGDEQ